MRPLILMSCSINEDRSSFSGPLSYIKALEAVGAAVVVIPPNGQDETLLSQVCHMADGILLPGGCDIDPVIYGEGIMPANGRIDPDIDAIDLFLAQHALRTGKPVLGICRGCQVLNVAAGGGLFQDLPYQWERPGLLQHRQQAPRWYGTHHITVAPDSLLATTLGETRIRVNSFHHQAVRTTGPAARVVARSDDGVIEAIEVTGSTFALGVQWHPEGMVERRPDQQRIFTAFVQAGMAASRSER